MYRLYGKAQNGREARRAARAASQNAKTLPVAGDFIEEQRGRFFFFHVELADGPELEIPIRAPDFLQLTQRFNVAQPRTQLERIAGSFAFRTQSIVVNERRMTVFMSVIMSDKSTFAEYDSQSEVVEHHSGMLK